MAGMQKSKLILKLTQELHNVMAVDHGTTEISFQHSKSNILQDVCRYVAKIGNQIEIILKNEILTVNNFD